MQNQQQHNENLHPHLYQPSLGRTVEAREREREGKRKAEAVRKGLVFRANLLNLCENHTGMFSSCGWLTLMAHTLAVEGGHGTSRFTEVSGISRLYLSRVTSHSLLCSLSLVRIPFLSDLY